MRVAADAFSRAVARQTAGQDDADAEDADAEDADAEDADAEDADALACRREWYRKVVLSSSFMIETGPPPDNAPPLSRSPRALPLRLPRRPSRR